MITRREFLKTAAALAACPSAQSSQYYDAEAEAEGIWTSTWSLASWTEMTLTVESVAFFPASLNQRRLEQFSMEFTCPRIGVALNDADLRLTFLHHDGDPPLLDARLRSGEAMFMLPSHEGMTSRCLTELGIGYEEWATRGLLGSYLHDFPRALDFADLKSLLFGDPSTLDSPWQEWSGDLTRLPLRPRPLSMLREP